MILKARVRRRLGLLGALLAVMPGLGWGAQPLWQMGRFDGSSAEFHPWIHPATGERQIDYSDRQSTVRVVIGDGDPTQVWRAYQPGSANGGTGFREHPATIAFVLPETPRTMLRLTVGLVSYSARLPLLQLDVNGRRGWFHQRPRLAYSAGDHAVFFQPHYSTGTITCDLRADLFKAGTNELVLTAIDVPGDREDVRPSGYPLPGNSGLIYDALLLERLTPAESQAVPKVSVSVEPTIFYREREGRIMEEVDAVVRSTEALGQGQVELTLGHDTARALFETPHAFGEQRATLYFPSWNGVANGSVRATGAFGSHEEPVSVKAGRRWQLWVVPHEHLDVGYTDDPSKVAELHSRVMDDAAALTQQHKGFAFTVDGAWVLEEYLAGRTAEQREHVLAALREKRLFVPAVHGSLFTGSASLEGLIRNLYPSRALSRQYGFPFDVAVITDVPSYSWSFASVLASAGIRYFVGASDAYRGPFLLRNRLNEAGPHAWEGPDGGRVVTWYSRHYHQFSSLFGLPPRIALGRESLPRFLQAYDHEDYKADDVIVYGSQVENVVLQPEQAVFAEAWNATHVYPRIRYSGFAEALAAIGVRQGASMKVERGDGGPYWEDGLAANARVTALARANARRILSAEKAATLASVWNPRYAPDREALASAWRHSLLIDEHTWHADCSVRDPESEQALRQGAAKDANATDAHRDLERVLRRSLSALADASASGPGSLLVFNPLSWPRRGVMGVEVGRGMVPVDEVSGAVLPFDVLRSGKVYHRLRVLTPDIPALGVRSLTLRPMPVLPRPSRVEDPLLLENEFYRVRLDPARGGIGSVVDKTLNREWVARETPYAFGQWLYVTGGDALPNRLVQFSSVSPVPELTVHAATSMQVRTSVVTSAGVTARWVTRTERCPEIETELHLPAQRRELRLTVRVRKEPTLLKEAAYVAFPLATGASRFRYATPNGFVDPAKDMLPGGCQEWFTVADWMAVEGEGLTVMAAPLDAPLITLGDIVRGTWPETFGNRPPNVFSYVMSNYTPEGYAAQQGGEFVFRYVFTSTPAFSAEAAARFGAEQLVPLESSEITRSDKLGAGPGSGSAPDQPEWIAEPASVHVSTWKPAEDGRGTILRLVETSGQPATVRIRLPGHARWTGIRCNAVEDDTGSAQEVTGEWRVQIAGFGMETLRILRVPAAR